MLNVANKADYTFDYYHPYHNYENPVTEHKKKQEFNPYVNNEGTVMAICGKDYIVFAGDTRLSISYSIVSRDASKIFQLTSKVYLASSGMKADITALQKYLKARIEMYISTNRIEPSLSSIAQMLSVTLYSRRFFPYYAFNLLCGQDDDGEFYCFHYDAVGSFEKLKYGAEGSGATLITPVLDNVLKRNKDLNVEQAKKLVLETMNGTSCRDIYTGDKLEVITMTKTSVTKEEFPLRND